MKKTLVLKNLKRSMVVALLLMFVVVAVNAVPARPGVKRMLTLVDGSTVSAKLVGDEYGHYWLGVDGKAYQAVDGKRVYQVIETKETLEKSKMRRKSANQQRMKRMPGRKEAGETNGYQGKKKGLVILVNFNGNVKFQKGHDKAMYERIANEKNFKEGDFEGSVYDYFLAQSRGKFELTFDVVGPVQVSKAYNYYGQNIGDNDRYPGKMVVEALKLADSQVNYADYDWNKDGEVDQVYIIYAGYSENDYDDPNTIWPHEWNLQDSGEGSIELDGVKIDTYACGGELDGITDEIAGIGTMCHEFSHCLGFPDFYDVNYSGGQGMFRWDLMDSGSYNGNGFLPAGYTSYERWVAGWLDPIELDAAQVVNGMRALEDGGESYIVYNQGNTNEYFMLENRQKVGWDGDIPGEGLLILHVDYNERVWKDNEPNVEINHQRMTWIPADNKYQKETIVLADGSEEEDITIEGAASDPFPYENVDAFNFSTKPAAKFYNKNKDDSYFLDSSIEKIIQNADGTVSFNFKVPGKVGTPTFSPNPGKYAEGQTVSLNSDTEGAVIYYTTDGTSPTANSTRYTSEITLSESTTIKAIAVLNGEESIMSVAEFRIGQGASNPETKTFKLVKSLDEMESDMRYIIACGSKKTAAGELIGQILSSKSVTVENNVITIGDDVAVFVLEGDDASGWSLKNESTGKYLYATDTKKLAYSDQPHAWFVEPAYKNEGLTLGIGYYGYMLYNANSPRFTVYTSDPNTSMIEANLYVEFTGSLPAEKEDVVMSFNPKSVTITKGDSFTEPVLTVTPENDAISVVYESSNKEVATVDNTTGKVTILGSGTATITANFAGNDSYNEASASYTLIVKKAATPDDPTDGSERYELVTDVNSLIDGDKVLIAYVDGETALAMGKQNTNNRAAVSVTLNSDRTLTAGEDAQVINLEKTNEEYRFDVGDGYLCAAGYGNNYLRTTDDVSVAGASIEISSNGNATIIFTDNSTNNHLRYNPNNGSPIFSCYKSTSSVKTLPQIYRRVVETVDVSIGTTGYATLYYSNKNLIVPENVQAYVYSINGKQLKSIEYASANQVIKKGTAVVLKDQNADGKTSHDYKFLVTNEEGTTPADNVLMGFDEDATTIAPNNEDAGSYKFYMLSLNANHEPESIGFYYAAPNGAPFTSKAHKAYLPVMNNVAANIHAFLLNGNVVTDEGIESTGIDTVVGRQSTFNGALYNLQGQRVNEHLLNAKAKKGIYIVNGRKVVIK